MCDKIHEVDLFVRRFEVLRRRYVYHGLRCPRPLLRRADDGKDITACNAVAGGARQFDDDTVNG